MLLLLLLLHLTPDDKQTATRMSRPAAALVVLLGRASCGLLSALPEQGEVPAAAYPDTLGGLECVLCQLLHREHAEGHRHRLP